MESTLGRDLNALFGPILNIVDPVEPVFSL